MRELTPDHSAHPSDHLLGRRTILKSVGAMIGASAVTKPARSIGVRTAAQNKSQPEIGGLRKRMISIMLPHEQFPVPHLVELGIAAEEAGFDAIATSDHFQPWQANEAHSGEAWVTMAALGARTKRMWMGTTVTCPTFRYNPGVVAEAFASLSLLYPGRIFLGVGSGEALNEQAATGEWPKWSEPSERLVEATDVIRRLWTGEHVSHQGQYFNVNAKLYDPPAQKIPLLMAGNGPKAMRRCGQYADGLITDPKTWREHKSEYVDAARQARKDPDQMPVLVEQFVVVGDQQEARKSAELWRFIPKAFKTYYNVRDPQEIQKLAERELTFEKVTEGWTISTDPEAHIKAINQLFDSGATIVNVHSGQDDQRRVIEFYGKQVLPKIKSAASAS
jgi:F420-dependent hydroxymycolic acid dehydrogenase